MAHADEIEAYIERFGSMVNRRCRAMLANEDDALDATQEVFVKLIEMGAVDIHAPSSLLYVIATRVCLNRLRTEKRRPETSSGHLVYEIATHDELGRTLARDLLDRLFGQNPESSKVIAVLHFCDGLTLQEVADEVGMSVSGVRRRIRVMRTQLQTLAERVMNEITDRTLERLRLGEFDEAESKRLMDELEARGELHRFEALVSDDESFVDKYPPAVLAARVREDVRHQRRNASKESAMSTRRTPLFSFSVLAAVIVVLSVVSVFWVYNTGPDLDGSTEGKIESNVSSATVKPVPKSEFSIYLRSFEHEFSMPETAYLGIDQIATMSIVGVKSVTASDVSVVEISGSDGVLYLGGKKVGRTMVRFVPKDSEFKTKSRLLVVGEALDPDALQIAAESEPTLLSCQQVAAPWKGVAHLTIVADGGGAHIGHAFFPGLTFHPRQVALELCLQEVIDNWKPLATDLSVGRINFDFGSGATCEPGKDC